MNGPDLLSFKVYFRPILSASPDCDTLSFLSLRGLIMGDIDLCQRDTLPISLD